MQNKNPVKQGHEINILFYRVLFTVSILHCKYAFLEPSPNLKYILHVSLHVSYVNPNIYYLSFTFHIYNMSMIYPFNIMKLLFFSHKYSIIISYNHSNYDIPQH